MKAFLLFFVCCSKHAGKEKKAIEKQEIRKRKNITWSPPEGVVAAEVVAGVVGSVDVIIGDWVVAEMFDDVSGGYVAYNRNS